MRFRGNPYVYAAGIAIGLLLFRWAGPSGGRYPDRDAMLGTWTDPAGPPGNSIRFYYVRRDLPGSLLTEAYEGHITLVHFLGAEKATATWNHGSWKPAVLNITVGNTGWVAAVRKVDDDHILIRFGTDAQEMYRPGAIDHADARRLTRIGREQWP